MKKKGIKEDLKDTLKNIKNEIVENSSDKELAAELLKKLNSVSRTLNREATIVNVKVKDVEECIDGDTFSMNVMKDGSVCYHVRGGYDLVCQDTPYMRGLNTAIKDIVANYKTMETMDEEMKEAFQLDLSASAYVLGTPMFAFSDPIFMLDLASKIVEHLRKVTNEVNEQEIQPEDPEKDNAFKDASLAFDELKKVMDEETTKQANGQD